MIEEDYVSFEVAKLLKEKGFNEKLFTFYITDETKKEGYFQLMAFTDDKIDNNHSDYCYLAPTLQMAMKWILKKYNTFICVLFLEESGGYGYTIENIIKKKYIATSKNSSYKEPEEACEAAIKYYLEHLI